MFKRERQESHVAQLVGCWTYNPRVVGSIPSDANCFMWDSIFGQDVFFFFFFFTKPINLFTSSLCLPYMVCGSVRVLSKTTSCE